MKLKALIVVSAIAFFTACETPYEATDTTVVVAPESARTSFVTLYPTASNVVWTYYDPAIVVPIDWELTGWTVLDKDDYLVRFNMNDEDYYAWYDESGNWIGTTYVLRDYSSMPTVVTNAVNNRYSGYTITAVNREFHADRVLYEVEMKNNTTKVKMLVDSNGNIIKEKSKPLY
jgi:uncharacterized membrane protein YkoI